MKTLTLVTGMSRPEPAELERMEMADEYPRVSLFERELNSDLLDGRYLRRAPAWRRVMFRLLPVYVTQVIEAFCVRGRYDAVISWAENLGIPFALLLRLTGTRTPHVAIFSWVSRVKKKGLLKFVRSRIDRMILMSSVQRDYAVHTLGYPECRVPLLRWPVDTEFWRPQDRPADMICAVGREMRDYRTLIQALRGLEIPCHIAAGRAPGKKDAWIRDIEDAGPLPSGLTIGKKSYSELRELYARSRFMVMPVMATETDNGSTSILEAMAMGKAVICSRTKGQVDIIREGETGLFVPVGDVEALRQAILALWDHPERASAMGARAREYVVGCHRLEDWIASVKRLTEEAAAGHGRHGGPRG